LFICSRKLFKNSHGWHHPNVRYSVVCFLEHSLANRTCLIQTHRKSSRTQSMPLLFIAHSILPLEKNCTARAYCHLYAWLSLKRKSDMTGKTHDTIVILGFPAKGRM
jgi:hypothetical protein